MYTTATQCRISNNENCPKQLEGCFISKNEVHDKVLKQKAILISSKQIYFELNKGDFSICSKVTIHKKPEILDKL